MLGTLFVAAPPNMTVRTWGAVGGFTNNQNILASCQHNQITPTNNNHGATNSKEDREKVEGRIFFKRLTIYIAPKLLSG
jgi:hypothetical protein